MGTGHPSLVRRLFPLVTFAIAAVLSTSVAVAAVRLQPAAASPRPVASTPAPAAASPAATVAPLGALVQPDVLVTASSTLQPAAVAVASRLPGVKHATTFAYGMTQLSGSQVATYGVDPNSFRSWAVATTAKSDPLWTAIARGELTTSFDAANELKLPLGGTLPLTGHATLPMRLGAFDTVGIPDADAVVSTDKAQELGLPVNAGMLISAPTANLRTVVTSLAKTFGTSAAVRPLRELPPLPPKPAKKPVAKPKPAATSAPDLLVPTTPPAPAASAPVALPAPGSGSRLAALITAAKSRIGDPYVYGADGPNAFDCSGFTGWSYRQIGISLPRSAAEQWVAGPHVSYADAQPGDVLAWAGDPTAPGYVTHVALYLGNGMMISAAHTGTTIAISPVYTQGLLGAVRFL